MTGDQLTLIDPPAEYEPGYETPPDPPGPDTSVPGHWIHRCAQYAHWVRQHHPDTIIHQPIRLPVTHLPALDQAANQIRQLTGSPAWVVHARVSDIINDVRQALVDRIRVQRATWRPDQVTEHADMIMAWVLARRSDTDPDVSPAARAYRTLMRR